jgi:ketosteroid isomerase-like protein
MTIEDWTRIADRFVRVLETGDVADLERLYHPDLRFTVRTAGTAFDRDEALANFRQMWTLLQDVAVEVVSRQATASGFIVQQVLSAIGPSGQLVRVPMCMIFTLRAGLIVGIDEYFDSAAVAPLLDEVAPDPSMGV